MRSRQNEITSGKEKEKEREQGREREQEQERDRQSKREQESTESLYHTCMIVYVCTRKPKA